MYAKVNLTACLSARDFYGLRADRVEVRGSHPLAGAGERLRRLLL